MAWSTIIGQLRVKRLLQATLHRGSVAHAYLFYGQQGIGKDALAIEFAKTLQCEKSSQEACDHCKSCQLFSSLQHPDVHLIFPLPIGEHEKAGDDPYEKLTNSQLEVIREQILKKSQDPYFKIEIPKANFIKINSIRDIKRKSSMARVQGRYKIFIIMNAELMNAEAANSLLKTLEEPLENTIFLLTTIDKEQLPQTIVSRCQQIRCDNLSEDDIKRALVERNGIDNNTALTAAQLADGSYGFACSLLSDDVKKYQEEIIKFLGFVVMKNRLKIIEMTEELVTMERTELQRWLEVLKIWLRAALIVQATGQHSSTVFNSDRFQRFVDRFANSNFTRALAVVDSAIAHIDKNVYLPLVIVPLAIELYSILTEQ